MGTLDLDDDTANLFAASVEVFGSSVLTERHPFPMDRGWSCSSDQRHRLYSAKKTKTKDFLSGPSSP